MSKLFKFGAAVLMVLLAIMTVALPVAAAPVLIPNSINSVQVGVNVNTGTAGYTTYDWERTPTYVGGQIVYAAQSGNSNVQLVGNGNGAYVTEQSVTAYQNVNTPLGYNNIQIGANANVGNAGTQTLEIQQEGICNTQVGANVNLASATEQTASLYQDGQSNIQAGANVNTNGVGIQATTLSQNGNHNVQIGGNVNTGSASYQSVTLSQN